MKKFNGIYLTMLVIMGLGFALLLAGGILNTTTPSLWGFMLLLAGYTGAVVTYVIEKETNK